ncbi:MerR family transcriptional regulator [Microbacterium sp.]|uniref:MerR family transcriptional regulator n=1 Tax=Microbacterium sp. TaxID=51671 RepID=UPI002D77E485|nr:MerR family transcriptional regulator [Microbacterium sp.]HET6301161.1 MerR family transcriptional regulator [Microbacterium sp.]
MRISELSTRSGVPVATLKFYIREGLLPRGEAVSATNAEYGEEHLARVRLIAALADVRGLPLSRVREILALIDEPAPDPVETLGRAVGALPPYVEEADDYPRAREAIEHAGLTYEPRFAAVRQLDSAIRAIEDAGLRWDPSVLSRYADAMRAVAGEEVAPIAEMTLQDAVVYAVLGTALYEPVMLALRRLAHHHLLVSGAVPPPTESAAD